MNITIEGINRSGKTTLKNAMVKVAEEKVHTVSNFFENHCNKAEKKTINTLLNCRPASLEDELLLKLKWANICLKRLRAINKGELSSNFVISDRGILSFFSHGVSVFQGKYGNGRKKFKTIFELMLEKVNFKCIPDYTIILDISYKIFQKRVADRERPIHYLINNKEYFQKMKRSYRISSKLIGTKRCILKRGNFSPKQFAKVLAYRTKHLEKITWKENTEILERLLNYIY